MPDRPMLVAGRYRKFRGMGRFENLPSRDVGKLLQRLPAPLRPHRASSEF